MHERSPGAPGTTRSWGNQIARRSSASTRSSREGRPANLGSRRWWAEKRSPWRRAARTFRRRGGRDLLTLGGVIAILALVAALLDGTGIRIQHTASLPKGIYRVIQSDSPSKLLRPGVIGLWCLPQPTAEWAMARGYLRPGRCAAGVEPLAKVVLATEGDTVDFDARGVRVRGRFVANSQPLLRDVVGRSLPFVARARYALRPGDAWVWSPYTMRSFDSRYFGPLPAEALVGIVRPVLTFRPNTFGPSSTAPGPR